MTFTDPEVFPVTDIEDFASHLGLDGADADMFFESYYQMNVDDDYDEEMDSTPFFNYKNYRSSDWT